MVSNLSLVFRIPSKFPCLILLCYFSSVQICEGASTGLQLRPITNDGDTSLFGATPNHIQNQTNEKLGEKCVSNPPGKFIDSADFKNEILMNELLKEVHAKLVYCPLVQYGGLIGYGESDGGVPCTCDCFFAHGASESNANCQDDPDNRKLCDCTYTDEDKAAIPCLQNEEKMVNSSSIEDPPSASKDGDDLYEINVALCDAIYLSIRVAASGGDNYLFKCEDGRILDLTPGDICGVDCVYVHGSVTYPYGVCTARTNDWDVCVCIF